MAKKEEEQEAAFESVSVLDCASYVRPVEPKSKDFCNDSKNINDVNDTYSHDVVNHYRHQA
jgi:hypothetical protein